MTRTGVLCFSMYYQCVSVILGAPKVWLRADVHCIMVYAESETKTQSTRFFVNWNDDPDYVQTLDFNCCCFFQVILLDISHDAQKQIISELEILYRVSYCSVGSLLCQIDSTSKEVDEGN
jgi:hypothetical protein